MKFKTVLVLCSLALICGACATVEMQEREPEESRAVRAQMRVKAALLESGEVAAGPVRVEYRDGGVRLTGFVETEEERRRAVEIAAKAVPDLRVTSDLEVWKPPD